LEEMALTDSQSGLPDRRTVHVWASRQLSAAVLPQGMTSFFWVVMTDVDLFKKVDDTFGHEAGDNVLKTFADTLRIHTRQPGICPVWGEHADKKNTETAVERIHNHFAGTKFTFEGSIFTATASFGIPGFRGTKPAD